jgi:hypothetical protein
MDVQRLKIIKTKFVLQATCFKLTAMEPTAFVYMSLTSQGMIFFAHFVNHLRIPQSSLVKYIDV